MVRFDASNAHERGKRRNTMATEQPTPQVPFGEAFGKVIEHLSDEKPFLYGIAGAILVIAVGTLGLTRDMAVMVGVLGTLLLGALLWLVWQARRVQTGAHPTIKLRAQIENLNYESVRMQNVDPGLSANIDAKATGKRWMGKSIELQNVGTPVPPKRTEDK
jgi:hypothetical protein